MNEAKQVKVSVEPLFEFFDCNDWGTEPIAFYCKGHIEPREFLKAEAISDYLYEKNEDRDKDIEKEEITLDPSDVKHLYWRVEKQVGDSEDDSKSNCDCEIFLQCKPDEPNAIAVTVIDLD